MSSIIYRRLSLGLGVIMALSALQACTTVEGTNAMVDAGTFEREVANTTLEGIGILPGPAPKEVPKNQRAPLALPKDPNALPAPREATAVAALPEDSDKVQIDTAALSEEDVRRLRNARVFDARSISGRPLTDEEIRQFTAKMKSVTVERGNRPLYLPPDEYFTTVNGQDAICLAANGELVSLNDPACPPEIRAALAGN